MGRSGWYGSLRRFHQREGRLSRRLEESQQTQRQDEGPQKSYQAVLKIKGYPPR